MALLHRWPTVLALGVSVAMFDGDDSDGLLANLSEIFIHLPLLYLIVAAVQRRQASWPVLFILVATLYASRALNIVAPTAVFVGVALIVLVWGVFRMEWRGPTMFGVQALGMLGFGALALIGLAVDPAIGRYLVAAGWFLHGIWDFVHHRADKVVARSYAEACAVLDVLVAAGLVFML